MMSVILITRVGLTLNSYCKREGKGNKYRAGYSPVPGQAGLHCQPGPDLLHAGDFLRPRQKEGGRAVCLVRRPVGAGQAGVEVQLLGDSSQQSLIDLFLPLVGAVSSQLLSYPQ